MDNDTPQKQPPDDEQALISTALTRSPDLSRYAEHARIGVGMWYCEAHGIYCERAGMVVIEVKGNAE